MTFEDYKPIPGVDWATNGAVPTAKKVDDRAGRVRLRRPAVRDHAAQEERSVRQPADRPGPAGRRAEVLRRLLQHAERRSTRATRSTATGWSSPAARSASPTSRPTARTGCRRSSTSTASTTSARSATTIVQRVPGGHDRHHGRDGDADDRGRRLVVLLRRRHASRSAPSPRRAARRHRDPGRDAHHGQRADHGRRRRDRCRTAWAPTSTPTPTRCGTRTRAARPPTAAQTVHLFVYAGYDETSVWQEFGEMMFQNKEDIPHAVWGNPNPNKPNWVPSRYVDWTSWFAGEQQWGESSIRQGESSGTITHEISHNIFSVGDNNNNPYVTPYHRVGSGTWDMMDRGSFNGPGGPHNRWQVPAQYGGLDGRRAHAALEGRHGLRARTRTVLRRQPQRAGAVRPGGGGRGRARGQRRAAAGGHPRGRPGLPRRRGAGRQEAGVRHQHEPAVRRRRAGAWTNYSLETVQRIGYGSFEPDNGVLIAKNKAWAAGATRGTEGSQLRLQLLHLGRGRAPGGHEHRRLLQARRHADHAHGRRLPAAQRRALPRGHELGLVGGVRRRGRTTCTST